MAKCKCFGKIFDIVRFKNSAYQFVISECILIPEYEAAAETKIPREKCIDIKCIEVLIPAIDKGAGNGVTLIINVGKTIKDDAAPIVPDSQSKVDP